MFENRKFEFLNKIVREKTGLIIFILIFFLCSQITFPASSTDFTQKLKYNISSNNNYLENNFLCTQDLDNNFSVGFVSKNSIQTELQDLGNGNFELSIRTKRGETSKKIFLPLTTKKCERIRKRVRLIEEGEFLSKNFPSFSHPLKETYRVNISLNYENVSIQKDGKFGKGQFTIKIKNNGTSQGKLNLILEKG